MTKAPHVILISTDGLAAYHLENEELELPNLRELIDRGVWAEAARTVFVETTDDFDQERDELALEPFFNKVLGLKGLERIIRPNEFHALGYPRYEENPYVRGQYIIIPDIDTYLKVDTSSESTQRLSRSQPYHGHGYLLDHPRMYPGLILSGNRIRKGHRIGLVHNKDVAPTIAEILSLDMPDVEGQVLWEALDQ